MKAKFFLLALLMGVLVSCASTYKYEPEENSDSLVVGRILVNIINARYYGEATVNGIHIGSVRMEARNISTGEVVTDTSNSSGYFGYYGLPEGRYQITKVYYKNKAGSSWADVYIYPDEIIFYAYGGKVYVIGDIEIKFDFDTKRATTNVDKDIDIFKRHFIEKYPESKWSTVVWE